MKSGYKTTEFYLALIPNLLLVLRFAGLDLDEGIVTETVLGIGAVITGVTYIIGRVRMKMQDRELEK